MIDQKLLQSIGNMAARSVCTKHPDLDIRFLAVKNGTEIKAAIVSKGDKSGRTARIFELKPLGDVDADAVKTISENLENQIEQAVLDFFDTQNHA